MPPKMIHRELVRLGKLLGYPFPDGVCLGLTYVLVELALAGKQQALWELLEFISQHKENFTDLVVKINEAKQKKENRQALDANEIQYIAILDLFKKISLYLTPFSHKNVFKNQYITQKNIKQSYKVIKASEPYNSDMVRILNPYHIFSREGLTNYLKTLAQTFGESVIPIVLGSISHTIYLHYDYKNDNWWYVDTNDFKRFINHPHYYRVLQLTELVDSIFTSFEAHENVVFNLMAYTSADNPIICNPELEILDNSHPIIDGAPYSMVPNVSINTNSELLFLACADGNLGVVKALISQGNVDINRRQSAHDGATSLCVACQNGHNKIVDFLLEQLTIDANSGMQSLGGPLYFACIQGHVVIVKALLDSNKINNVDAMDKDDNTALLATCVSPWCKPEVLLLLLENGANISHKNKASQSAIDLVFKENNEPAIAVLFSWIIDSGMSLERLDSIMQSSTRDKAIKWAIDNKNFDLTLTLIRVRFLSFPQDMLRDTDYSSWDIQDLLNGVENGDEAAITLCKELKWLEYTNGKPRVTLPNFLQEKMFNNANAFFQLNTGNDKDEVRSNSPSPEERTDLTEAETKDKASEDLCRCTIL